MRNRKKYEFVDLVGQEYGKLKVISPIEKPEHLKSKGKYWLCQCQYGRQKIISTSEFNRKSRISCGKCGLNTYDFSNDYGIGYTKNGEIFLFDKEDFQLIKDYTWSTTTLGYLIAYIKGSNNKFVYMHRLILGLTQSDKYDVDHINHKVNDNRKDNLRICTHQNNIMNSKLSINNTSGVTGVRFDIDIQKWTAVIVVNYKTIHLGLFSKFEDAVNIRKQAEQKYFGEFAYKKGKYNE